MEKLRMSPAEILKEVQIKPIEMECLKRVFEYLSKHHFLTLLTQPFYIAHHGKHLLFEYKARLV